MINYNYSQQILHDIFLGNKIIKKSIFEIEKIFFLKKNNYNNNKHIFITGLPRSGTTSLLNFFNKNENLCSLKYKNMPFIMSPNISRIFSHRNINKTERYHNDNIFFDLKSPEAFDEIFLSTYGENEIFEEFSSYVSLILSSNNKKRYLSKNNNNYTRINLIRKIFPNSVFIIPIRDPLQHAYSLYKQHINFTNLQKKNNFILRYMNYLGHNEFGNNHVSWFKPILYENLLDINYWLEQWYLFYKYIVKNYAKDPSCYIVAYENLENNYEINSLVNFTQIEKFDKNFFNISFKKINLSYDKKMYENAKNIHNEFLKHKNI